MSNSIPKFIFINRGEASDPGHVHAEITLDGAGWSSRFDASISEHFSLTGIITPERATAIVEALNGSLSARVGHGAPVLEAAE